MALNAVASGRCWLTSAWRFYVLPRPAAMKGLALVNVVCMGRLGGRSTPPACAGEGTVVLVKFWILPGALCCCLLWVVAVDAAMLSWPLQCATADEITPASGTPKAQGIKFAAAHPWPSPGNSRHVLDRGRCVARPQDPGAGADPPTGTEAMGSKSDGGIGLTPIHTCPTHVAISSARWPHVGVDCAISHRILGSSSRGITQGGYLR
jgi:hypothetical protein